MNKIALTVGISLFVLGGCSQDGGNAADETAASSMPTSTDAAPESANASAGVAKEGSEYPGYPGMTVVDEMESSNTTGSLTFTTPDSIAQVLDYYRAHAAFKEWPVTTDYDYGGDVKAVFQATADRGGMTVNADREGDLTRVKVRYVTEDSTFQGE